MSLVKELINGLSANPEEALELADTLCRILSAWEKTDSSGNATSSATGSYVIRNMMGVLVAQISLDYPKWKITINGEPCKDAPFITHGKDVDLGKIFVEDRLREKGYIVRSSRKEVE